MIDGRIYSATAGGLQIFASPQSKPEVLLNADGLGTVDLYDVMSDNAGTIWVAGNGRLAKIVDQQVSSYLLLDRDNEELPLYRLADDVDFIWIGSDLGLLLFSKTNDEGQIQESYSLFDNLTAEPAVFDVFLDNDSIWIATSSGLAVADKSDPSHLKSPQAWKGISSGVFLSDTVNWIVKNSVGLFAASPRAIVRVADMALDSVVVIDSDNILAARLSLINDSVYYFIRRVTGGEYGIIQSDSLVELSPQLDPYIPNLGVSFQGELWISEMNRGLFYPSAGEFKWVGYAGMSTSDVRDVSVLPDSRVIAGYGNRIVSFLRDSVWNNYIVSRVPKHLMADSSGRFWVGTDGSGLWLMEGNQTKNYDKTNSTLFGNNDDTSFNYIVVNGLENDGRYVYAACYRAANGYPVAIGDLNDLDNRSNWDSLGKDDGIDDIYVSSLDVFGSKVAIGTEQAGLYICDLGDDPFDHSQRACSLYTTDFDRGDLVSNTIRVVRFDPDGNLWAGTSFGISRWDPGLEKFVEIELPSGIGTDISDLEFDTRGNLWVGTSGGLARRDATTGNFTVFTERSSDLLSNRISSLHFESATGLLYIGTDRGISVRPSATSNPTGEVNKVIAFPNPFIIRSDADHLFFNFSRPGTARLFTVAGELVREIPVNLSWDGRNESGEAVASGVYLYLVEDESGEFGRGKILLVRE